MNAEGTLVVTAFGGANSAWITRFITQCSEVSWVAFAIETSQSIDARAVQTARPVGAVIDIFLAIVPFPPSGTVARKVPDGCPIVLHRAHTILPLHTRFSAHTIIVARRWLFVALVYVFFAMNAVPARCTRAQIVALLDVRIVV